MNLPQIESYSEGTGMANCMKVVFPNITVWYSYSTPVAFYKDGRKVVRVNDWSTTTGKHLNWIDGGNKKDRVSGQEFERLLAEATA